MKRKFIINPHSGGALSADGIARLQGFFTDQTGDFDHTLAQSRDQAVDITREALRRGIDQIVAVGGDGTVNAVANGFFEDGRPIRPESTLAIADAGTGSDYFKSVTDSTTVADWKDLVVNHAVRGVDLGRIRYTDPNRSDQYFLNMASAGMVAEVVRRKQSAPGWLPPRFRYLVPTIGSFFSCRPCQVRIETDGGRLDTEVLAVSVCKGTYAGRGMKFGGQVTLFDGLFDVTLFGAMRRVEMLWKLRKLYTGAFQDEQAIQKLQTRRISIRAPAAMPIEFDGELGGTTDVELSIVPQSLRVCFPKTSATSPGP